MGETRRNCILCFAPTNKITNLETLLSLRPPLSPLVHNKGGMDNPINQKKIHENRFSSRPSTIITYVGKSEPLHPREKKKRKKEKHINDKGLFASSSALPPVREPCYTAVAHAKKTLPSSIKSTRTSCSVWLQIIASPRSARERCACVAVMAGVTIASKPRQKNKIHTHLVRP